MNARILLPLTGILLAFPAAAVEISVRADGLGDVPTIQDAVDTAMPGDEIVLEDGTFTGTGNRDVDLGGKDLVIRSRNGAGFVTIDAQGVLNNPHRALRITSGETSATRIDGITFTGGYAQGAFPESGGGGILVAYGSHPVIENCVFEGNETGFQGFGAGLLAWEDCDITMRDCIFRNNTSGWYGGGFTLRKFCDALVERVHVEGNYALHAGGGASITNSTAILNDCVFLDNETTEVDGGGLLIKAGGQPVLTRCVFAGNRALVGGALGLGNYPEVTLVDCLFENNFASSAGGAICVDQEPSTLTALNCTFVGNEAVQYGGHLVAGSQSTWTIRNSVFGSHCGAPTPIHLWATSTMDIDCSLLPGGAAAVTDLGTLVFGSENVDVVPEFCGATPDSCEAAPTTLGDYTVDSESPAASGQNPCGRLGALPVGCGSTDSPEFETMTWGRVKSVFRSR